MKRSILLLVFMASFVNGLLGQIKLAGYQYWFNSDYENRITVAITPATGDQQTRSVDASLLPEGLNSLNMRYYDDRGVFSTVITRLFFKDTRIAGGPNDITAFEVWFNNDHSSRQRYDVALAEEALLVTDLDASALPFGINILNVRSIDTRGDLSIVTSRIFMKVENDAASAQISAFEIWFNSDYDGRQVIAVTPGDEAFVDTDIDASTLPQGLNVINMRAVDTRNVRSIVVSRMFTVNGPSLAGNTITARRYWFDDDKDNAVTTILQTPAEQVETNWSADMSHLAAGTHDVNVQFMDASGQWSVVSSHSVSKGPLPVAGFSYALTPWCDSARVDFADRSIDAETWLWDFGDGITSTESSPSHTYRGAGTYPVSLTVSHSGALSDSTKRDTIKVLGTTTSTVDISACLSYISPSGKTFTASGTYRDTIPNIHGCDSVITINLTVNSVDISVTQNNETLTAGATGATYQWLNCNDGMAPISGATSRVYVATKNGSYAVKVTMNGCTDTSACYSVTSVGIDDTDFGDEIRLWPNPTGGRVTLDLGGEYPDIMVTATNTTGMATGSWRYFDSRIISLDISGTPGSYFLTITAGQRRAVLIVIKE